jgi:hypothetical protein
VFLVFTLDPVLINHTFEWGTYKHVMLLLPTGTKWPKIFYFEVEFQ